MAKLSARGRTQIWRVAKEDVIDGGLHVTRKYYLMSDNKILKSYGSSWSLVKLKPGVQTEQVKEILLAKGYKEVLR